jgi:hypothetical protein
MSPPPLPNRVKLSERHNPSDTNQITKNLSTKCNTVAKLLSWFRAVGTGAACGGAWKVIIAPLPYQHQILTRCNATKVRFFSNLVAFIKYILCRYLYELYWHPQIFRPSYGFVVLR